MQEKERGRERETDSEIEEGKRKREKGKEEKDRERKKREREKEKENVDETTCPGFSRRHCADSRRSYGPQSRGRAIRNSQFLAGSDAINTRRLRYVR